MNETNLPDGSDCRDLSRREFVKTVGTAAVAASVPLFGTPRVSAAPAGPSPTSPAEGAVARFFKTLKDDQHN
ncbi:MAG: twin-arginine translocation signal domain-containing protein [Singulisphaera sp.]